MSTVTPLPVNMGTTQTFELPQGWTLRKIATALAREWLPPFRAVVMVKAAPWMVQPVVEETGAGGALWEAGISTAEYEERLDRFDLSWVIRAKAGRGRGTILARLAMSAEQPAAFHMVCSQDEFPATLFDAAKLAEFQAAHGMAGSDGLFAGLLIGNGFRATAN
jgi:hypothetical protein